MVSYDLVGSYSIQLGCIRHLDWCQDIDEHVILGNYFGALLQLKRDTIAIFPYIVVGMQRSVLRWPSFLSCPRTASGHINKVIVSQGYKVLASI